MTQSRREFLRTSSWAGLGLLAAGCAPKVSDYAQKPGRRVVVIGGGWGGTSAAKYVRLADPSIEVILLEPNKEFVSCPFSNLVLSGVRTIESLTFSYDRLRAHGATTCQIPDLEGGSARRRDEDFAVGRHAPERRVERGHLREVPPQRDFRFVLAAANEPSAVGGEFESRKDAALPVEDTTVRSERPEPHGAVGAARHQPFTIRREPQCEYAIGMAAQRRELVTGRGIPDARHVIDTTGGERSTVG